MDPLKGKRSGVKGSGAYLIKTDGAEKQILSLKALLNFATSANKSGRRRKEKREGE